MPKINPSLKKSLVSIALGLLPLIITILFFPHNSSEQALAAIGLAISMVILIIYIVNLLSYKVDTRDGEETFNTFSYLYKAEQLAENKGISKAEAWSELSFFWELRWVAFPCTVAIISGGPQYLILGYILLGAYYFAKHIFNALMKNINKLESD